MPVRIDFVAGHALQARAGESVFTALQDRALCEWRIGRNMQPTGAEAIVLMDHTQHHPSLSGWKHRFYLMHDLGDVLAYKQERQALRRFSMVIVPDSFHARRAVRYLWPWTKVRIGGWPKYDVVPASLPPLPEQPTVLYAPTWAGRDEWRTLLPLLAKLPVNVIVKNHTYATTAGEVVSEFYRVSRLSVVAMEEMASRLQMIVVSPELNICALFPRVDAVITDQSSVAAEFLPWGPAYETGATAEESGPSISRWYADVIYRPLPEWKKDLSSGGKQLLQEITARGHRGGSAIGAGKKIADMIWRELLV